MGAKTQDEWRIRQPSGDRVGCAIMAIKWSPWKSLGKPGDTPVGKPFVQRNQDGRLEVFASARGEMFNIAQLSPNGPWRSD
jgi:hypothetical protein